MLLSLPAVDLSPDLLVRDLLLFLNLVLECDLDLDRDLDLDLDDS
jgi:hypothetical protein